MRDLRLGLAVVGRSGEWLQHRQLQQRSSGVVMSAIEDLIRKLLALADSPNEHEAAAAAEKAQELMLRHGIELATVAASTHQPLKVDEDAVSGKADPWRRILAGAVASSAGGRVVWHPDCYGPRNQGRLLFYGPAGTVHGMVDVYRYLETQLTVISAIATASRAERHVHGRTWRNSFLLGAVGRLSERLHARRNASAETSIDDGRALVLVKTAVDREIERRHPSLVASSYQPAVDGQAYAAGGQAAQHVELGDKRLRHNTSGLPLAPEEAA